MIFIWSTSDRAGSQLIKWGRNSDCSHFAVCFDKLIPDMDDCCWLVGESRLDSGVDLDWLSQFKERNTIVHALEYLPIKSHAQEYEAYCQFTKEMSGRDYDDKAVLWLAIDSLLQKVGLRNPYPDNKWGDRDDVYCQEIIRAFGPIFARDGLLFTPRDLEMLDPHEAFVMLVSQPQFRKIELK